jgi:hypothetical protein
MEKSTENINNTLFKITCQIFLKTFIFSEHLMLMDTLILYIVKRGKKGKEF